ncbi:hypothetical protein K6W16_22500 [Burkholderia dolosa]|uniref:Lipoprotein n=2 Tax=Burkholderiaceae TaxID=119060 RepID=A0A892HZB7_9BURK|nr:hypothetical protein [Burkholderia dolosa]MBY4657528.1 hypothetical protein [Burkholderia dolosa]MBY4688490.1 hypothetical protein [Burkholderia dolosa]MBY4784774.1 hypothetical protein [Burkholderia dolosa]MBY4786788.1 hypothetical protein [Burkholderia dolosa]
MRILAVLVLCMSVATLSSAVVAADDAFAGVFRGTGRACSGALYVRAKTIEWNSSYSICKSSSYEILEKKLDGERERMVFRLKNRSSRCRYSVVEVERAGGYSWNVSGYQSLEGFRKRDLPEWSNSPFPERQILSCLMTGPD